MINQFQVTPLDIGPAIDSLSLTKAEAAIVSKSCDAIRANLQLERDASPDALRAKVHDAEIVFNTECSEEALAALQEAGRKLAGASESFPAVQRATLIRNEAAIDELKEIALRVCDSLHSAIREAAGLVAQAETAAKTAFSNLDLTDAFDDRLQRTLDLLSEDRKRIEQNHAALHFLVSWHLAENPYR